MMFFVESLNTYVPKNRAWKKLCDYVGIYKYVLVKDEISKDALVEDLRQKVNEINAEHPKLKPIKFSAGACGGSHFRIDASVDKMGCPDMVFILDIVKVRSIFQYCESKEKGAIE